MIRLHCEHYRNQTVVLPGGLTVWFDRDGISTSVPDELSKLEDQEIGISVYQPQTATPAPEEESDDAPSTLDIADDDTENDETSDAGDEEASDAEGAPDEAETRKRGRGKAKG